MAAGGVGGAALANWDILVECLKRGAPQRVERGAGEGGVLALAICVRARGGVFGRGALRPRGVGGSSTDASMPVSLLCHGLNYGNVRVTLG